MIKIKITSSQFVGVRIDIAIPKLNQLFSRSQIQKYIKEEALKVNAKPTKASYLLALNDVIEIDNLPTSELKGENIPLDVIYEDEDVIVINKPRGLVVHPGSGNLEHTLVNALIYRFKNLSNVDPTRPGIVHRIDKDTSGLLVVAKNNFAHRELAKQLENHSMHREYQALVKGVIHENSGRIIAPIGRDNNNPLKMSVDLIKGKEAETTFKVIRVLNDATLVDVKLKQGRTHQIRVHFEYIKHPLIGDPLYGEKNKEKIKDGQILHAYQISFIHPTQKKEMTFTCPLPKYFLDAIEQFKP